MRVIFQFGMTKQALFEQAKVLVARFNEINDLPAIPIFDDPALRGFWSVCP